MSGIPRHIPNHLLRAEKIPPHNASWDELARFALTFNGYEKFGFERCAEIANSRRQSTLTELRTCLFFEQRRWRHVGETPDGADMAYIRELVEQIRARVALANLLLA